MIAQRGTIWTVPQLGPEAIVLIASNARGLTRGRAEYQGVPLYLRDLLRAHSADDFKIHPSETSLGVELFAALWNARPILGMDLGNEVGRVISDSAMHDLSDAYLRIADPRIAVRSGRLGSAKASPRIAAWQATEITRWQPLSGRVLSPSFRTTAFETFVVNGAWNRFSFADIDYLERFVPTADRTSNQFTEIAVGPTTILISGVDLANYNVASDALPQLFEQGSAANFSESFYLVTRPPDRRFASTGEFRAVDLVSAA